MLIAMTATELGHDNFLPNPFQFIFDQLPNHMTPYGL